MKATNDPKEQKARLTFANKELVEVLFIISFGAFLASLHCGAVNIGRK